MASVDEIVQLKRLAPYEDHDDSELGELIDANGLNGAAAKLWTVRVSATANLVDVTESGSSRKMSQVHDRAKAMAEHYKNLAEAETLVDVPNTAVSRLLRR